MARRECMALAAGACPARQLRLRRWQPSIALLRARGPCAFGRADHGRTVGCLAGDGRGAEQVRAASDPRSLGLRRIARSLGQALDGDAAALLQPAAKCSRAYYGCSKPRLAAQRAPSAKNKRGNTRYGCALHRNVRYRAVRKLASDSIRRAAAVGRTRSPAAVDVKPESGRPCSGRCSRGETIGQSQELGWCTAKHVPSAKVPYRTASPLNVARRGIEPESK